MLVRSLAVPSRARGRRLAIDAITSVDERDTLTPAVPGITLPVTANAFAGLRPSYRCLAWQLGRNEYPVRGDLPGDDRPET